MQSAINRSYCTVWALTACVALASQPALAQVASGAWIESSASGRIDTGLIGDAYVVDVRALNLRPEPSTRKAALGVIHQGDYVRRVESTFNKSEGREWFRVTTSDQQSAWVASEYLEPVSTHLAVVEGALGFLASLDPTTEPVPATVAAASDEIRAGFVYVGPVGDAGWSYQHDVGREELDKLPFVAETSYREGVPEEDGLVGEAIDELVAEGNNLIFTTSYGYMDPTIDAAKRHEDVVFMHASGFKTAPNAGTYFGRMYQARYLAGIVAGGMTRSGIIGYVAAFPIPEVIRGINAFTLGAQQISPDVEVRVLWTETWYGPGIEREMAEKLLDYGADVLTMHQDSPATVQAAAQRGKRAIGYHSDMSIFAPEAVLTSAVWDWSVIYTEIAERVQDGTWRPDQIWWGLDEGVVGLAPLAGDVPQEIAAVVERRRDGIVDKTHRVFEGPIRDQDGVVRVPSGKVLSDAELLTMDYFVLGVKGELPVPTEAAALEPN